MAHFRQKSNKQYVMIQTTGDNMRRIEIIHLRVNGTRSVEAARDLLKQALKTDLNEISQSVNIYHHQSIEEDLCVILNWKTAEMTKSWYDLGLHLTAALKEFGWVDHSIWIEG